MLSLRALTVSLVAAVVALMAQSCTTPENRDGEKSDAGPDPDLAVVEEAGVGFEAPDSWTVIDPAEVLEREGDHYDELGNKLDMSADDLREFLASNVKLKLVTNEKAGSGVGENLTVTLPTHVPDIDGDQAEELLEDSYASLGAEVRRSERSEHDVGPLLRFAYTLEISDVVTYGDAIWVEHDGRTINITASSLDADNAEQLIDDVVESLTVVG